MSALLSLFFFAFGAVVASFVTVVSERAYTGQSWVGGRSKCDSCRATLAPRDLVPLLSWFVANGRCRFCKSELTAKYVVAEVVLGFLFGLSYLELGLGVALPLFLVALTILAFIVLYDIRHTIVPPVASFLFSLASLAFVFVTAESTREVGLTLLVAGGISLFIFLIFALTRGRGMGLGDAPIAFSLALLAGSALAFSGLLLSFWIGALFGIGILLGRRGGPTMGIEVPFVPFLAAGFLLAYFTQWNPLSLLVL